MPTPKIHNVALTESELDLLVEGLEHRLRNTEFWLERLDPKGIFKSDYFKIASLKKKQGDLQALIIKLKEHIKRGY